MRTPALLTHVAKGFIIVPALYLTLLHCPSGRLMALVALGRNQGSLLASAMDMHLSVLSNRMNQIMKTLTVISTILMSAGLIAGIYGMNFDHMPELHTRYGYYGALAAMIIVSFALFVFFRRKRWI